MRRSQKMIIYFTGLLRGLSGKKEKSAEPVELASLLGILVKKRY
jgi:hypothetical protein